MTAAWRCVPLASIGLLAATWIGALVNVAVADQVPSVVGDPQPSVAADYSVGVAKIDITPNFPVMLSGYAGRPQELTQEVSAPLFARAIAIGAPADQGVVLIAVDNCGVPAKVRLAVAKELHRLHGIDIDRVTVTATHTHSAPMLIDTLANLPIRDLTDNEQRAIDRYTAELTQKLITVASDAISRQQPCQLQLGYGSVDFAFNRRGAAAVDHRVPMLVASDADGRHLAILTNYACHCVSAGSGVDMSGDWAGAAAVAIEAAHPEATAIVLIGCGADQNPRHRGGMDAAQLQGQQLAEEVSRLLGQELRTIQGDLTTQFAEVELPLAPLPTQQQWAETAKQGSIAGYHAQKNLDRLDRGETLPEQVRYPIQTWAFGDDLAMVFLGGEVVVDYSLELQRLIDPERLWVTAYANDVACYIPSERVLKEGGYEGGGAMVWYDWPASFAPGLQYRITSEIQQQLGSGFAAPHDPSRTGGTLPSSPAESVAKMQIPDGFRVDVIAAEPLIADPVAIDFGHDGRLWVAEMHDYPEGLDGQYLPGGRIKVLQDTDGDGVYDHATTFLDNVPFPTGVTVWRDGVLISTAPDVLYAVDRDGDGKADHVETMLSGFYTENYQARVNSITLGLDNWMHGASGIFGGKLTTPSGRSVDSSNRDFRFLPGTDQLESASGRSQQGRVRDDFGNWFGNSNSDLLFHYPTTEHYHSRNPQIEAINPTVSVAQSRQLFPLGELVQWELSGPPGLPTAACGIGVYRDNVLGEEFFGNSFTCEPVNQLVHRMQLHPKGTTFTGTRAASEREREFLSSTDNWFRPVQATTGPDGGLYIVDMYRYMIEHPKFLSDAARAKLDVRAGDQLGRIYRVVPESFSATQLPNLSDQSIPELVSLLTSSNGVLRDMVHQQLLWRDDSAAIAPLRDLLTTDLLPQSRIQVLVLLDHWQAIDEAIGLAAIGDSHPQVRRHAVRLTERFLDQSAEIVAAVIALATDADPQVRQQVAYSLGQWHAAEAGKPLAQLALAGAADPYLKAAVFSSLTTQNLTTAVQTVLPSTPVDRLPAVAEELLAIAFRVGDDATLGHLLQRIVDTGDQPLQNWQWDQLPKLMQAIGSRQLSLSADQQSRWQALLDRAAHITLDPQAEIAQRTRAMRLLPLAADPADAIATLAELLTPQTAVELQQAAVTTLASVGSAAAAEALFAAFPGVTPVVQAAMLDVALARPALTDGLLVQIENGGLPIAMIPANHQQTLSNHPSEAIRQRWQTLASGSTDETIAAALAKYRDIDPMRGQLTRGQAVFVAHCAVCHQMDGVGHVVGPDLRALTDRSQAGLLSSIVDPNAAIDQRYATYSALTVQGLLATGIIESESSNDLVLLGQEGRRQTILRSDLDQLQNTGVSLMPTGLDQTISPSDMEHLLAYLGVASGGTKYQYLTAGSGTGSYPDDPATPKLTDGHSGSPLFTDGTWVGFLYQTPADQHTLELDLAAIRRPDRLRITYGVNHQPGNIRAPTAMLLEISEDGETFQPPVTIADWDDSPDGLGVRQIQGRKREILLPSGNAKRVRLTLQGQPGWLFLAEIEAITGGDSPAE